MIRPVSCERDSQEESRLMGNKTDERLNEAAKALVLAIADDTSKASEVESKGVSFVAALAGTLRHIAPGDTEGRSDLRAWVYERLKEKTGKKYFNLAMNGLQKEWFIFEDADALASHFAEHGVVSLAGIKRLAEEAPSDGGTARGFKVAKDRAAKKADRDAAKERFENADPVAKLALFALDTFGSEWREVVVDLSDMIVSLEDEASASEAA